MVCPSVFVLLLMVNKEAALGYGRQGRIWPGGKTKLNAERKKVVLGRCHVAAQEARCEITKHEPRDKM